MSHLSVQLLVLMLLTAGCQSRQLTTPVAEAETTTRPAVSIDDSTITIAAVGDILLGSTFPDDSRLPPNDGADLLKAVKPILSDADIAFGNMEGPIVDGGTSEKCPPPKPAPPPDPKASPKIIPKPAPIRCFAFRMPTRYAKHLKEAGFDVLSLANNHASDFGELGRASTRRTLDSVGIKHAGSDRDRYSTAYIEDEGLKVAFIGFAHNAISPNVNDLAGARRLVEAADQRADIVVVSFHGGAEGIAAQRVPRQTELYFNERRGNLPLFARTVIDAGADLVLGHGPHVLRGIEIYKDRLIAYSLGNFATYGWFKLYAELALTVILETTIDKNGRFVSGRLHAGRQEGRGIPVLDPSGASVRKIRALSAADFPLTAPVIADDGRILPRRRG